MTLLKFGMWIFLLTWESLIRMLNLCSRLQMAEVKREREEREGCLLSEIGPTGPEIYGVDPIMIEHQITRDEWI